MKMSARFVIALLVLIVPQVTFAHFQSYVARLGGSNVLPPNPIGATGTAFVVLNEDITLSYVVACNGLGSGANGVISAAIYTGGKGANGIPFKSLALDASGNGSGYIALSDTELAQFLRSEMYVSVQTSGSPSGAIRGAMELFPGAPIKYAQDFIRGDKEIPPTASAATATAYATLTADNSFLFAVRSAGLGAGADLVTAAHVHVGGARTNGPILIPLTVDFTGNGSGTVRLTEAQRTALLNNEVYVDVHTGGLPDGAIRGQFEVDLVPSIRYSYTRNLLSQSALVRKSFDGYGVVSAQGFAFGDLVDIFDLALAAGPPLIRVAPDYDRAEFPNGPVRVRLTTQPVTISNAMDFTASSLLALPQDAFTEGISQADFAGVYYRAYGVSIDDLDVNEVAAGPYVFGPIVVGGEQLGGSPDGPTVRVTGYNITFHIESPGQFALRLHWKSSRSLRAPGALDPTITANDVTIEIPLTVTGRTPRSPYAESAAQRPQGGGLRSRALLEQLIQQALADYAARESR